MNGKIEMQDAPVIGESQTAATSSAPRKPRRCRSTCGKFQCGLARGHPGKHIAFVDDPVLLNRITWPKLARQSKRDEGV